MTQPKAVLPGTALHEDDFRSGRALSVHAQARAAYAWDAGLAIGRYLEALKEGYFLGVRCDRCGRTVVPPRMFCERCFGPMDALVPVADLGTVNTFSLCYVTWDVKRIADPLLPAVIDLDGTSPRVGILHLLGEVEPEAVRVGMRVQAVWKPRRQRRGAITDIRYFTPLAGG